MINFRKLSFIFLLPILVLNGCAVALIGAGAAGGLAISRDGVSTYIDGNISAVLNKAHNVLTDLGEIKESDRDAGIIKAIVKKASVTCIVEGVTPKTVKLTVKARKNLLPNIELAHSIALEILERTR